MDDPKEEALVTVVATTVVVGLAIPVYFAMTTLGEAYGFSRGLSILVALPGSVVVATLDWQPSL